MSVDVRYSAFLKFAALCSVLGALTTALLIFLPSPVATDAESRALLHENTLYLSRLWILFIHPQVNLIASLGVGVLLFRKYPLSIIVGGLFLTVWAYTEMTQQALLIDALNQLWRPGYLNASDDATKTLYATLIEGTGGLSDSHYFLVIYGFGLGCLLYGLALIREDTLGRAIGVSLIFIGLLSLASFLRYYLGVGFLSPPVNWAYTWVYPYLQPAVRVAIGIWIIQQIRKVPA